jgi:hypothetical protein
VVFDDADEKDNVVDESASVPEVIVSVVLSVRELTLSDIIDESPEDAILKSVSDQIQAKSWLND